MFGIGGRSYDGRSNECPPGVAWKNVMSGTFVGGGGGGGCFRLSVYELMRVFGSSGPRSVCCR